MSSSIITAFVVGIITGLGIGMWWGKRKSPASVFTKDSPEAEMLRTEAKYTVQDRIKKRKVRVMEAARKSGRITNDDVEDLFCISDRTAGNYLHDLAAEGKLLKVGKSGRNVHYIPTDLV